MYVFKQPLNIEIVGSIACLMMQFGLFFNFSRGCMSKTVIFCHYNKLFGKTSSMHFEKHANYNDLEIRMSLF